MFGKYGMISNAIRSQIKKNIIALSRSECNLNNYSNIRYYIKKYKPGIIINAAAFTDVNKCETKKKYAKTINADSLEIICKEAKKINALVIHFSTDFIFDGKKKTFYNENDKTNPLQYYGKMKKLSEENIIKSKCRYYIFRISWIYSKKGNNFVNKLISKYKTEKKVYITDQEKGTPTSAEFVALRLKQIISIYKQNSSKFKSNIFNLSPYGIISRYNFAKFIYDFFKAKYKFNCKIIRTQYYNKSIRRPYRVYFSKNKILEHFSLEIINWKKDFIKTMKY